MPKKRMDVHWKREIGKEDLKPAIKRYRRYLEDKGLRASTIPMYVLHVSKYLEFAETDSPCEDDFARFRDHLHDKKLFRSTINRGFRKSRSFVSGSTERVVLLQN